MIQRIELVCEAPSDTGERVVGEGAVLPSGTAVVELNGGHAGDSSAGVLLEPGPDGIEELLDEFDRSVAVEWLDKEEIYP
jgi:hypothetical protein